MNCNRCGKKVDKEYSFCPFCGSPIEKVEVVYEYGEKTYKKQSKCWKIFAKVSRILGIVTISICFIPLFGIVSGSCGITFGILGKHSDTDEAQRQRKTGIILSSIGAGISFVMYIALVFGIVYLLY